MKRILGILCIVSLAAAPVRAQTDGLLAALSDRARKGEFGNVDALYVVKDGKVLLDERYTRDYRAITRGKRSPIGCGWDCPDSSWMHEFNYLHPEWHPWYKGGTAHTLQSVTKSVTATLIGIAMQRGEIKSMDAPLLSFFGRYDVSAVDARLQKATLADLLTMRSGIEWHENDRPLDSTNTTLQLENSKDWIRFTLAQPMDAEPGAKWVYNSGGSELMAEIVRSVSGRHADDYAREHLFTPLGITDFHWKKTPTGHPDTEGGLFLAPTDLAKIGQLYMDDGVRKGKRILPAGWAKQATARIVDHINPANQTSPGYGYQWWRYDRDGVEVWAGNGFGGQFLIVMPQYRVVGVTNSWNAPGLVPPGSTSILNAFIAALIEVGRGPR